MDGGLRIWSNSSGNVQRESEFRCSPFRFRRLPFCDDATSGSPLRSGSIDSYGPAISPEEPSLRLSSQRVTPQSTRAKTCTEACDRRILLERQRSAGVLRRPAASNTWREFGSGRFPIDGGACGEFT
jgi:hypothetical protein